MDDMKMFLICSSHLDREWYLSYEETRIYACGVIDKSLELLGTVPEYRFMLDGQTSVLEDYLEIYPEREAEIAKYIAEGRLVIGPWYIQPDEYIPAGESMIRNLLLGEEIARRYGECMKVGYLPDSFGHVSQLPQILKGFGIDTVFMSRGLPEGTPRDFCWEGIDKTRVVGMTQCYGSGNTLDPGNMKYGIHSIEDPDEIRNMTDSFVNAAKAADLAPFAMLIYGGDMMPPAKNFLGFGFSSYDNLEDCLNESKKYREKFPTVTGELRNSPDIIHSLQDTAVSRVYLKTENHRAQNSLINFAEPLCFLAYGTGEDYPQGFLKRSWRYLLDNHTHDGICGCSNNDVHDEMMTRFRKSENISERWADIALGKLASETDTGFAKSSESNNVFTVFNPSAHTVKGTVECEFSLICNEAPEHFKILDGDGADVPYQIIDREIREFIRSDFESVQHFTREYVYRAALQTELPAFGLKAFEIAPAEDIAPAKDHSYMENELVRLCFNKDGTFDMTDKITGKEYKGLNYYVEEGDGGDSYKYIGINGKSFDSRELEWHSEVLSEGPLCSVCRMYTSWMLPAEMTGRGEGRSAETVENGLDYTVTLYADSPVVHIKTVIDNRSKDHRIRAWMPTGVKSETVWADSVFSLEKRRDIMLRGTQPMQSLSAVNGDGFGLAVFSKGLHQYEYLPDSDGALAVSLIRGQGVLYRGFFHRYNKEYSGCQCIGKHAVEYAVCPYAPEEGTVPDKIVKYGRQFTAGWKTAQTTSHTGHIPHTKSFISVETPYIYMTTAKMTEDKKRIALRFCSYSGKEENVRISLGIAASEVVKMSLDEKTSEPVNAEDGKITLTVKPHEIFTLGLGFAEA